MATQNGIRAGRAYVELSTQNNVLGGLKKGLSQVKSYVAEAASVAKIPLGISVAGLGGAAMITKQFASFDDTMRLAAAVSSATTEQLKRLTDVAKTLGRTTSWTAEQVASGMVSLGRMGFNAGEIENATNSVMNLARATGTEIGLATDIAGNALRSFGLDASQMGTVADILTTTANSSAQTLEDLGESLKYVSPIARAAGLDLKETSIILGQLANVGIKGSQAGTSVKSILARLSTEKISQKLSLELGIETVDETGNLRAVSDILADIGSKMRELPNAQQLDLFKNLFGLESLASGVNLATADFSAIRTAMEGVDDAAKRTADAMDAGLGGSLRIAQSAVEGVALAIGDGLAPTITEYATALSNALTPLTNLIATNSGSIVTIAKWTAIIGGASAAVVALGTAVSSACRIGEFFVSNIAGQSQILGRLTGITQAHNRAIQAGNALRTAEEVGINTITAARNAQAVADKAAIAGDRAALAFIQAKTAAEKKFLATVIQTRTATLGRANADMIAANTAMRTATANITAAQSANAAAIAAYRSRVAFVAVAGTAAAVLAVGAAFVYVGGAAKRATEAAQKAIDKVKEQGEKDAERFQNADSLISRLKELDSIQNKNNDQLAESSSIIQTLSAQYGNLGLSVDAATGKIKGLTEAQEELNRQKLVAELASKTALRTANQGKIDALKKESDKMLNARWYSPTAIKYGKQAFFGQQTEAERQSEIKVERKTLGSENAVLDAEIKGIQARLEGMKRDKAIREKAAQQPPEPPQKTQAELAIEAEQKRLATAKQDVLFARVDLANAEKGGNATEISDAQTALNEANKALSDVERANATAAADRAATAYEEAKASGNDAQIQAAAEQLETALNALDKFETGTNEQTDVEKPLSETERTLNALLGRNTLNAAQTGIENAQERTYLNDLKDAFAIQEAQKQVEKAQASLAFENVFGDTESQIVANREFTDASEKLGSLLEARGLAGGAFESQSKQAGTFDAWEALSLGQDDWQKEETKKQSRFLDLLSKDVSKIVENLNKDEDLI